MTDGTDLERDVRALLREMGDEIESRPGAPRPALRRARRKLVTNALAGVVALATAAGVLVVGARLAGIDDRFPPADNRRPSPVSVDLAGVQMVVGDRLAEFAADGSLRTLATLPGPAVSYGSRVATPHGTLMLLDSEPAGRADLWLIRIGEPAVLIAPDLTQGFAVSADGDRAAFGLLSPEAEREGLDTEVQIVTIPDNEVVAHGFPAPGYGFARVVGFAGDNLVISAGDGGHGRAFVWDPTTTAGVPLSDEMFFYGGARGSSQISGKAILSVGDGGCLALATLSSGRLEDVVHLESCLVSLAYPDFSQDGALVAGVGLNRVDVVDAGDGTVLLTERPFGAVQAIWHDASTLLVLRREADDSDVWRVDGCSLVARRCSTVWTGTLLGEGAIALVARS